MDSLLPPCRRQRPGRLLGLFLLALLGPAAGARAAAPDPGRPPLQVHPDNPRIFLFRGQPLVLITATEHYGSVINRPFDFEKYLDDHAARKMTLTRTFLLYRELQTPRNPWSPCKPETPDFITPYPRTTSGKALDGEPLFDLDRWNPEYFDRLHRFLQRASDRGVVVELTLFSHTYGDAIWALNPLRGKNNKQGIGTAAWQEYDSLNDRALVERQAAFARKIVQETCAFDNVYYEICNEPAGGIIPQVSAADVDAWLAEMARVVRDELTRQGRKHLVVGAEAFNLAKRLQEFQATFAGTVWDAVIVHPHPLITWGGRMYPMGNFMSKELALAPVRDFCLALYPQRRPVVLDEDNAASMYRDLTGWTIHRKRAWTTLLCGAHYDYIDFSVTVGHETGTPASRAAIRTWMKNLSEFIHSLDLVQARPGQAWIGRHPNHLVVSTLAVEGKDYAAYLADDREATDPAAGSPIEGDVDLALPAGSFLVRLFSPVTGLYSPGTRVDGGKPVTLAVPAFRHDLVIRATRLP